MITAGQDSRDKAARLRMVLDQCERIMADPNEAAERREAARRWHEKLGGVGSLADGAYGMMANAGTRGHERHTRGGGQADHQRATYDGWGEP